MRIASQQTEGEVCLFKQKRGKWVLAREAPRDSWGLGEFQRGMKKQVKRAPRRRIVGRRDEGGCGGQGAWRGLAHLDNETEHVSPGRPCLPTFLFF